MPGFCTKNRNKDRLTLPSIHTNQTQFIILPKYKTVIFVHGCFWHQHEGCRKARRPTSNVEFWNAKLDKNMARDAKSVQELKESGWKPVIVWECELKDVEKLTERLASELSTFRPFASYVNVLSE